MWRLRIRHIEGLEQDCSNSIANALELLQSCAKPSILPCSPLPTLLLWCPIFSHWGLVLSFGSDFLLPWLQAFLPAAAWGPNELRSSHCNAFGRLGACSWNLLVPCFQMCCSDLTRFVEKGLVQGEKMLHMHIRQALQWGIVLPLYYMYYGWGTNRYELFWPSFNVLKPFFFQAERLHASGLIKPVDMVRLNAFHRALEVSEGAYAVSI